MKTRVQLVAAFVVASRLVSQTSDDAFPLMAELAVSTQCGSSGVAEDQVPAAAILFGFRQDTIFAVTANHAVRSLDPDCLVRNVQAKTRRPFSYLSAKVRPDFDQSLDLAVIAAVFQPDSVDWKALRRPLGVRGDPGTLYLIGCPAGGSCYESPLQVRVRKRDSVRITVQSAFVEEGYSGGPAVDGSGQLIGMTLNYGGQNATLLRWPVIEKWLIEHDYPLNIPIQPIDALGHLLLSITISSFSPPKSPAKRLLPSINFSVESWDSAGGSTHFGVGRMAQELHLRCAACADRRAAVATLGYYASLGIGFAPRNKGVPFIGPNPVSVGFAGSLLAGWSTQLVRRNLIGEFDPATGEPSTEHFTTKWSWAIGYKFDGIFNASATKTWGFRGSVTYTILTVDTSFGVRTEKFWNLGIGPSYRVP